MICNHKITSHELREKKAAIFLKYIRPVFLSVTDRNIHLICMAKSQVKTQACVLSYII